VKAPVLIGIDAAASDADGTIQQVSFFANGALIGTDAASPFSVAWSPAPGSYTLTAVATDDHYGTGTSSAVHVTVLLNRTSRSTPRQRIPTAASSRSTSTWTARSSARTAQRRTR